jgi:hypothetical protein
VDDVTHEALIARLDALISEIEANGRVRDEHLAILDTSNWPWSRWRRAMREAKRLAAENARLIDQARRLIP